MESPDEKIERLRKEREETLRQKYLNEDFYLSETGGLSRYGWGENLLYVGMMVRVKKPSKSKIPGWRNGIIEYIKIENKTPKIGVICGVKKIKFEKSFYEVSPSNQMQQIVLWEGIEVPERLKKMSTFQLLSEFRKRRKDIRNDEEEQWYKKELYLREHVGTTNKKIKKQLRQKKSINKT